MIKYKIEYIIFNLLKLIYSLYYFILKMKSATPKFKYNYIIVIYSHSFNNRFQIQRRATNDLLVLHFMIIVLFVITFWSRKNSSILVVISSKNCIQKFKFKVKKSCSLKNNQEKLKHLRNTSFSQCKFQFFVVIENNK